MKGRDISPCLWVLCILALAALACNGSGSESVRLAPTEAPAEPQTAPTEPPALTPSGPTATPVGVESRSTEPLAVESPSAELAPTGAPPPTEPPPPTDLPSTEPPPTELPPPTEDPPPPEPPAGGNGDAGAGGIEGLANEIYIGLGGGDGAFCNAAPEGVEFPTMSGRATGYGEGWLCLWGFEPEEEVLVELHDPSRGMVASRSFVADLESDGVGGLQVTLWLVEQPPGEWFVLVESASAQMEQVFVVDPPQYPRLSVVPASGADPFGDGWLHCGNNSYPAGAQAVLVGTQFPPGSDFPVGIYHRHSDDWEAPFELVWGEWVAADNDGRWRLPFEVGADWPPGQSFAVVSLYPEYAPFYGGFSEQGAIGCLTVE